MVYRWVIIDRNQIWSGSFVRVRIMVWMGWISAALIKQRSELTILVCPLYFSIINSLLCKFLTYLQSNGWKETDPTVYTETWIRALPIRGGDHQINGPDHNFDGPHCTIRQNLRLEDTVQKLRSLSVQTAKLSLFLSLAFSPKERLFFTFFLFSPSLSFSSPSKSLKFHENPVFLNSMKTQFS